MPLSRRARGLGLALLVGGGLAAQGCEPTSERGVTTARPPSATSAGAPRPVDDDEVQTVDDTVPANEAPADEAPDGGADAAADGPSALDGGDEGDEPDEPCAPEDPTLKPLTLLRFSFTDGIEGKDPRSKLDVAKAGQRVYAHLTLRNRSGRTRCVHLTFRVGGKKRTEVTLKIGPSWSWRTFAYNTLRADDNKPLELTVRDDQNKLILERQLPVIPSNR